MTLVIHNKFSSTLSSPRIDLQRFKALLKTKNSPVLPEADAIWNYLLSQNVDPSYALGQFRYESQYGTAGHAVVTKSWGNMVWDDHLSQNASGKYQPGNGFTYSQYDNWLDGVKDYVIFIYDYIFRRNLTTIFEVTAEWIQKVPGSDAHLWYCDGIVADMERYDWPTKAFVETGDEMIYAGKCFDPKTGKVITRYPLAKDTIVYKGTNGEKLLTYTGANTTVWFLGLVNNSKDWGQIRLSTQRADPDSTFAYIKDIDLQQVFTIE